MIIIWRQNTPFPQSGFTDFHHIDHFLSCATELVHTGSNQERYRENKYTTNGKRKREDEREKERREDSQIWNINRRASESASAVPAPLLTHLRQNKWTLNAPEIQQNPRCLFHSDSLKKHEEPDALLSYLTTWRMSNTTKHVKDTKEF